MTNYKFPDNFLWGAAASGPQTEGFTNKANKSVWETWFDLEPDRFYNHYSNYVACDTYNRFKDDVKLMKDISMNSFRTSIQWSRLIEDFETGKVSEDAVRFYREYFTEMKNNGIQVVMGLYHFDMPTYLIDTYGGFESKKVVELYADYAQICFENFADLVDMWSTFNEPIVPVEGCYFDGFHYPNKIDAKMGIQVAYNTMLASAKAIERFKAGNFPGEIGVVLNLTPSYPRSNHPADELAARRADLIFNHSFMEPAVYGTFPKELTELLAEDNLLPETTEEEKAIFKANICDFVGVNYYVPRRVKAPMKQAHPDSPLHYSKYFDNYDMPGSRNNPHRDNNEIYPKAVYDIAKIVQEQYGNIKWYIAEIGISITNEDALITDGMVDDSFRTDLFIEHMIQLHKAIEEGSNCFGVHQWTFIDNWSWLNSHKRRYGFYYLDLDTRERHIKKHALWFKELCENNSFDA